MAKILSSRRKCFLGLPVRLTKITVEKGASGDLELIIEKGLFKKSIEKVKIYKIRDTAYFRSFFQFFMGVGNVMIWSSDSASSKIYLTKIRKGNKFTKYIEERASAERKRLNVRYSEASIL